MARRTRIRWANPVWADGGPRRILSRMTSAMIWSERVADWRTSGLTSKKFCEGREFSAGGLRHWAYLLGRDSKVPRAEGGTRLARVVRVASPRGARRAGSTRASAQEATAGGVVVEFGQGRVAVSVGFDRSTLAAVLDVLAERGQGGGQ
jgi:hypothetical protein